MSDTQTILNKLVSLEKQIALLSAEVERMAAILRPGSANNSF